MKFTDACNHERTLKDIDVFLLQRLREANLDLSDISGESLLRVERDPVALFDALRVLVLDVTDTDLAKGLRGEAIDSAVEAVRGAVKAFFPQNRWSEMESSLSAQKKADDVRRQLDPLLSALNSPDMPVAMREAIMEAIAQRINSLSLEGNDSASGPDKTPPLPVSDTPDSAVLAPAG